MESVPYWSVMIPTYNCTEFLGETLESVLTQGYNSDQMQIEVIDDCSHDNPEKLINHFGGGRVLLYRQNKNGGHVNNFKTAINRAKGEVIHLLHGDDFVSQGFYKRMEKTYEQCPEAMACFSRFFFVDTNSNLINVSPLISDNDGILEDFFINQLKRQLVQTPSITVKRKVYEQIGSFNEKLSWTEDWEMWARIGKYFKVAHIKDVLAYYRVHQNSSSGKKSITGENLNDLLRLKEILLSYAPENSKDEVNNSLNKIICYTASNNYTENFSEHPKEAIKNLLVMSDYSEKLIDRLKFKINYLVKSNF